MAIVINKLTIIAYIMDGRQKAGKSSQDVSNPREGTAISDESRQQIIEEAVQQVMDILERQKER